MKNLQGKTVKKENAYEVWQTIDGSWTWYILKKYQSDDMKPYARAYCLVKSPFTPNGEYGDTYLEDIRNQALRIK